MISTRPQVLRTPDERFRELPGFPFGPRDIESLAGFEGLRLPYLDEGNAASPVTFLCLHGQPTWSYLYPAEGFLAWRAWVNANPDLAVGRLMRRACPDLSEAEAAAYDAPFPSAEFKAGARRFPNLVCDDPDADGARISRLAARWWQREWRGQSFMAIGMQDVVIPPSAMHWLRQVVHGCPDPLEVVSEDDA